MASDRGAPATYIWSSPGASLADATENPNGTKLPISNLKVIWSVGKGSEIFRENSYPFDFHLTTYYECIVA